MKTKTKTFCMRTTMLLLLMMLTTVSSWAQTSGNCGTSGHESDVTWSYNSTNNTLTISGTGAMADYASYSDQPWYNNVSNIKNVIVGDGITHLGNRAFEFLNRVENITIGKDVETIGNYVCKNCSLRVSITIPPSVTEIGTEAFANNDFLSNVYVLSTISPTLGTDAFGGYHFNGFTIYVPSAKVSDYKTAWSAYASVITANTQTCGTNVNWAYDNGTLYIIGTGAMADNSQPWSSNSNNIKNVVVGDGVTHIGNSAFRFLINPDLTITFGKDVQSIGNYACQTCSLKVVTIPASVTSIGDGAFANCHNLSNVYVQRSASVPTLGNDAFSNCSSSLAIYVPTTAYASATNWSTYASKIKIGGLCGASGDNVTWAYDNNTLTIAGTGAMEDYTNNNDKPWYNYSSSIKNVVVGDGVTHIGNSAFRYLMNPDLTIAFGKDVQSIGNYVCELCSLKVVTIPASVTSIGERAFRGCYGLDKIYVLPTTPPTLGNSAFGGSNSLAIYVPTTAYSSATNWSAYASKFVVYNGLCGASGSTVVWTYDNNTLTIAGTGAMKDYTNNSDKPWNNYSSSIKNVVVGDGVTHIGNNAFRYLMNPDLTITFGKDVQSIGNYVCEVCSLKVVTIPASVTSIGEKAFDACYHLDKIYVLPTTPPTLGSDAFRTGTNVFYVHGNNYTPGNGWDYQQNTNIYTLTLGTGVTAIGDVAVSYDGISYYETGRTITLSHGAAPAGTPDFIEYRVNGSAITGNTFNIPNTDANVEAHWEAHNLTAHPAVAATCTTAGNSAYWECTFCGKYFSDENGENEITANSWIIDPLGHDFGDWVVSTPATCTTAGSEYRVCTRCTAYENDEIPATGHMIQSSAAVAPTCTDNGHIEGYECTVCHKYFSDDAGTTEIAENSWVIPASPATGHNFENGVCTICGHNYAQGTCGDTSINGGADVTWSYDSSSKELTISGDGAMMYYGLTSDYLHSTAPWNHLDGELEHVIVNNGVTSVGAYAFAMCSKLVSASLPTSVFQIYQAAFYTTDLIRIDIPRTTAVTLGENAFSYCHDDLVIAVPSTLLGTYKNLYPWITYADHLVGVLSETTGFNANYFATGNYEYTRTFKCGVASTVCLPFSVTAAQAASVGKFYTFAGIDKNADPWEVIMEEATNKVSTNLTANTPYLFKPYIFDGMSQGDAVELTFSGTVSSAENAGSDGWQDPGTHDVWMFLGVYDNMTWNTDPGNVYGFAAQSYNGDSYTVNPGDFVKAAAGASIAPFRAFLQCNTVTNAPRRGAAENLPSRMTVRLVNADGETTSLTPNSPGLSKGEGSEYWYDLSGRKLDKQPTQKGVYINNGKKVAIK